MYGIEVLQSADNS